MGMGCGTRYVPAHLVSLWLSPYLTILLVGNPISTLDFRFDADSWETTVHYSQTALPVLITLVAIAIPIARQLVLPTAHPIGVVPEEPSFEEVHQVTCRL